MPFLHVHVAGWVSLNSREISHAVSGDPAKCYAGVAFFRDPPRTCTATCQNTALNINFSKIVLLPGVSALLCSFLLHRQMRHVLAAIVAPRCRVSQGLFSC